MTERKKTELTTNGERWKPSAKTEAMEVQVVRSGYGQPKYPIHVAIHDRLAPDARARFALACVERWAMIAGQADGEDSTGRQKGRRMTPDELADHACQCTEKIFAAIEARGWIAHVPAFADLMETVKDQENSND